MSMTGTVHPLRTGDYIIITPMRNEASTVEITLKSVVRQTVKPLLWIILDDGSTDGSSKLVEKYCMEYGWIKLKNISDRGFDLVGQGVAEILNYGLDLIRDTPSDYIAKLDADLDLPETYFERLLSFMEADKRTGICSGHPFTHEKGKKFLERHGDFFPSGTARLYRRKYLDEIGDFVNSVGWDTVDILRMRMRGYSTRVLHDVLYHHMRRMGTRNGYIDGMIRDGRNAYLTGYTPVFFVCRALFNMRFRPYLLRTACMLWGYFKAYSRKLPQVVTDAELKFHVQLQKKRLRFQSIE